METNGARVHDGSGEREEAAGIGVLDQEVVAQMMAILRSVGVPGSDDSAGRADSSGRAEYELLASMVQARNLIEHHMAGLVGVLDRLGVATRFGRTLRELLIVMGLAPVVAQRLLRIARGAEQVGAARKHCADGDIGSEHLDAIVSGVRHVSSRMPAGLDRQRREELVADLLAQRSSGATPAQILERARSLGNLWAPVDAGGVPVGEDRRLNTLSHHQDADGRVRLRADLDVSVGAKLATMLDGLSAPRPEPDGSRDQRSAQRRAADGLEALLDMAANRVRGLRASGAGRTHEPSGGVRTQLSLVVPADAPGLSSLEFTGAVSEETARRLGCDPVASVTIVDGQQVPVQVGRGRRLFTPGQRAVLVSRDAGCIKCGAPASWCQAHHIVHWSRGGPTDVDNGCLLCPGCHDSVHHGGWDVEIGSDGHPWLLPPPSVDRYRRRLRSFRRRTMALDDVVAA